MDYVSVQLLSLCCCLSSPVRFAHSYSEIHIFYDKKLSFLIFEQGIFGGENDFVRIEVVLERFENPEGLLYNGQRCDFATGCDVEIKTAFDLTTPLARYPGSATTPQHFQKTARYREANVINMQETIRRDICKRASPLPSDVTVRIEANDRDVATGHDLIDEFDCTFPLSIKNQNVLSETRVCHAVRRPNRIKITYRYRIYRIDESACRDRDITPEEYFNGVHGENRAGQPAPG